MIGGLVEKADESRLLDHARSDSPRGDDRNRTGVDGFAGRCVATPPRRRGWKRSAGPWGDPAARARSGWSPGSRASRAMHALGEARPRQPVVFALAVRCLCGRLGLLRRGAERAPARLAGDLAQAL